MAHGNSLRSIVKHLNNISDKDIAALNIPNGIPLVYEFDEYLNPVNNYYLGIFYIFKILADPEELKKLMNSVAN